MKLIKTASGDQAVKMSKSEWEAMGRKAGWMKEAKWSGDAEIKQTGEWAGKTIEELEKDLSTYKKKQENYEKENNGETKEEYTSKMKEINFAIRSKKKGKGKWGDVK